MSLTGAIAAFAQRGRRGSTVTMAAYSAALAVVIYALTVWLSQGSGETLPRRMVLERVDAVALITLALIGFVLVPAAVAAALTAERRAGTLDQLRTTALSPLGLALGFVLGVPARLYLLCVGPLALHVIAGLTGAIPLPEMLAATVLFALGAFTSAAIGLCLALSPRHESGSALSTLGVAGALGGFALFAFLLAGESHPASWSFVHPVGALSLLSGREQNHAPYAWVPMASGVLSLAVAGLALPAACRKLRAPELPLLSKRQALAAFTLSALCLLLPFDVAGEPFDRGCVEGFSVAMLPIAMVLAALATPSFEKWALALRRGRRPRWSADDAGPFALLWGMELVWAALLAGLQWSNVVQALGRWSPLALGWALMVALSLPLFLRLGATRFVTPAARGAFAVAMSAHLVLQLVAIGGCDAGELSPFASVCLLAGVLVPAWVAWAQAQLRRRVLAPT